MVSVIVYSVLCLGADDVLERACSVSQMEGLEGTEAMNGNLDLDETLKAVFG